MGSHWLFVRSGKSEGRPLFVTCTFNCVFHNPTMLFLDRCEKECTYCVENRHKRRYYFRFILFTVRIGDLQIFVHALGYVSYSNHSHNIFRYKPILKRICVAIMNLIGHSLNFQKRLAVWRLWILKYTEISGVCQ